MSQAWKFFTCYSGEFRFKRFVSGAGISMMYFNSYGYDNFRKNALDRYDDGYCTISKCQCDDDEFQCLLSSTLNELTVQGCMIPVNVMSGFVTTLGLPLVTYSSIPVGFIMGASYIIRKTRSKYSQNTEDDPL